MSFILKGTGVALITPFSKSGGVDYTSLRKLLDHVISGGVEYLVVQGTTGESVVLTKEEKAEVSRFIVEYVNDMVLLVMGIGGNNTIEVAKSMQTTKLQGYSAILSVSPYYNKPTQEGIYQHYKFLASESPLPIILYNVPGRTGTNMTAQTTLRLAHDFSNIIAVKEASGNLSQCMEVMQNKPAAFELISGDDILTYPLLTLGATGVISVIANAYPKGFSDMVRLCLKGKYEEARTLHYYYADFINLLFSDGSPGGIKAALAEMGLCENVLRLPLVPVNQAVYAKLSESVKTLK